jgi:hypothetical protein
MTALFRNLLSVFALGVTLLGQSGIATVSGVPVCERSPLVLAQLALETEKSCTQITDEDLSRLDHFQIGFNNQLVKVLPGDLGGLTSARFLYLNCNDNLASVPGDLIDGMEKLEWLAIHTNPMLTSLPEGIFASLKDSTEVVAMSGNGLTSMPESFYAHFAKRKTPFTLYLTGNRFTPETLERIQAAFNVKLDANGELPHIIGR